MLTLYSVLDMWGASSLKITFNDGTQDEIIFEDELIFTIDKKIFLKLIYNNSSYSCGFAGIERYDVNTVSGIDELCEENANKGWKIFSIDGRFIKSGIGKPELSDLSGENIYILKTGENTVKFYKQ